jgi:adenylate cyclase
MSRNFGYPSFARRFAANFPTWNYLLIQIFFWFISYLFLGILAHLVIITVAPLQHVYLDWRGDLIIAAFLGFCTGVISGFVDQLLEKRFFINKAIGVVILIKAVIALFVFVILISFVRYSIYPFLVRKLLRVDNVITLEQSWEHFFQLMLIYNIAAGLLISFINQVNKKFGPGVLLPLLLGRYRSPREEKRIFLFMDLKSSTPIAETLGHLKYSAFIRDSFMDINTMLSSYHAQIYQYVGDEVVVTWTVSEGLQRLSCVRFFFACEEKFKERSAHYIKHFGQVPEFKAGLHMGKVTVVEVGNIKRDIAYHGDTMNTAARIQSVCNQYNKRFLISKYVFDNSEIGKYYYTESLGMIELKGKNQPVEVASIESVRTIPVKRS